MELNEKCIITSKESVLIMSPQTKNNGKSIKIKNEVNDNFMICKNTGNYIDLYNMRFDLRLKV